MKIVKALIMTTALVLVPTVAFATSGNAGSASAGDHVTNTTVQNKGTETSGRSNAMNSDKTSNDTESTRRADNMDERPMEKNRNASSTTMNQDPVSPIKPTGNGASNN